MASSKDMTVLTDPEEGSDHPRLFSDASGEIAQLRRLVAEREALHLECDHRWRNQLQLIVGLLGLEAANQDDPRTGMVLRDMAERVAAVGFINHELIVMPGRTVDFALSLTRLCRHLDRAFGRFAAIEHEIEIPTCILDASRAMQVALILNELLMNAFKHAFPSRRRGRIVIHLDRHAGVNVLTVRDNGVGIAGHHHEGTGSRLLGHLVTCIRGQLTRESSPGKTIFTLRFLADPASAATEYANDFATRLA